MSPDRMRAALAALSGVLRREAEAALREAAGAVAADVARRLPAAGPDGSPTVAIETTADGVAVTLAGPRVRDAEYGTADTAPRPVLRPAVEAMRPEAERLFAQAAALALATVRKDRP